jgi:hypothetical protein
VVWLQEVSRLWKITYWQFIWESNFLNVMSVSMQLQIKIVLLHTLNVFTEKSETITVPIPTVITAQAARKVLRIMRKAFTRRSRIINAKFATASLHCLVSSKLTLKKFTKRLLTRNVHCVIFQLIGQKH